MRVPSRARHVDRSAPSVRPTTSSHPSAIVQGPDALDLPSSSGLVPVSTLIPAALDGLVPNVLGGDEARHETVSLHGRLRSSEMLLLLGLRVIHFRGSLIGRFVRQMPRSIDGIVLGVPQSHDRAVPSRVTGAV